MSKVKIDFHGSTHGHFLEYVSNVYIMSTAPSEISIFKPPAYSAHAADLNYQQNKIIECKHYSSQNYEFQPDERVIRITLDSNNHDLFFIAMSNLMYKAGDIGIEKQMLSIPETIRNDPAALRNNWYSKINEREKFVDYYKKFAKIDNPIFEFSFESFFSFDRFCVELSKLADFLNDVFLPDRTLYSLHENFLAVNQGWQSYQKCKKLLENIYADKDCEIQCTVIEEAWINFNLSVISKLYDGVLFTDRLYPTNTKTIYSILQEHNNALRN